MAKPSRSEQLNQALDALFVSANSSLPVADAQIAPLLGVAASLRDLPRPDFKARLKADLQRRTSMASQAVPAVEKRKAVKPVREGFHTITPYITVNQAPELIDFIKQAFGAEELFRGVGTAGGYHCEMKLGDSMLMIGGGLNFRGTPMPTNLWVYFSDVDAVYRRAIEAGATSLLEPQQMPYGERGAAVKDLAGNNWYLATYNEPGATSFVREGLRTVTPYPHPKAAAEFINFLKQAFGAEELFVGKEPTGHISHAQVRIGDSVIAMSDARGEYQPKPSMFYLYVEDADALYNRAIRAGAISIWEPKDQPYGDRVGGVKDAMGNEWYIATHIRDVNAEDVEARKIAGDAPVTPSTTSATTAKANWIREGFRSVTPYLIVERAAKFIDFAKEVFGATERFRVARPGSSQIMHAEMQLGESIVELADSTPQFAPRPAALHLFVPDPDAVYQRAIDAGAASIAPPTDHPYGERSGSVRDSFGNDWYVAKATGPDAVGYIRGNLRNLNLCLFATGAHQAIAFMQRAFGAEELMRSEEGGVIHYAEMRIGDSVIEVGEARAPHQPLPAGIHLYVPNVDEVYARAIAAGAQSIQPPTDQPYGDRSGGVRDAFGNQWFIATHLRDVQP